MHFTEGISSRGCCCFPAEKDFWWGAWEEGRGPKPSLVSASAPRHRYQLAQDKDHVQVSPDRWVVAVLDKAILTKLEKFFRGNRFKTFPCHSRGSAWSGFKSQNFPFSLNWKFKGQRWRGKHEECDLKTTKSHADLLFCYAVRSLA